MFKKLFFLFLFFVFLSQNVMAQKPTVSAHAAVVTETETGNILYEKNAHTRLPMASTTKIMTAICTIENINTNIPITVNDMAVGIEGSSIYLKKGEVITVKELLYGMMLNSGNDAAVALAVAVSGSVEEFCSLMNITAKNIGAKNTNFTNPSGLYDENHYTTAYDLALISSYALKNPLFKEIVASKHREISGPDGKSRYLKNHNKLLWISEDCIGVKTGYTKKCGRCLVSASCRNGTTLVAVTLNAPDDWNDHTAMMNYGFSNVTKNIIAREGEYATSITIDGVLVPLCFDKSLEVSLADENELTVEYEFEKDVSLPVFSGQNLGSAALVFKGETVSKTNIIALKSIPLRKKDGFGLTFLRLLRTLIS